MYGTHMHTDTFFKSLSINIYLCVWVYNICPFISFCGYSFAHTQKCTASFSLGLVPHFPDCFHLLWLSPGVSIVFLSAAHLRPIVSSLPAYFSPSVLLGLFASPAPDWTPSCEAAAFHFFFFTFIYFSFFVFFKYWNSMTQFEQKEAFTVQQYYAP